MATATCTAYSGVLEATGERVGSRVVLERVGFWAKLSQELTGAMVASRWDEESLDVLAAGVDEQGESLPSKGWMALRRLGWPKTVTPPAGVYVSDRVRRGVEEYAARTLRLALHRRTIVAAILATWPADPHRRTQAEWAALRAVLPTGVSGAEIRNRTRQIRAHLAEHGHLPASLCTLEEAPQVAPQVLLAAMDRQQTTLQRVDETTARLRVKLPLGPAPASGRDWAWHILDIRLPATVDGDAVLHMPTLRPTRSGRIAVDLPHSRPAPTLKAAGHVVGLGFDWGVNTLLTGTLGRLTHQDSRKRGQGGRGGREGGLGSGRRVVTDGRALVFDATAVSAKLHRLRGVREYLAAKRDACQALADGLGSPHADWAQHAARATVLGVEHARVCARIRHLNDALAWAAARWAVDQATALGASVIYLEDLATLEARGRRRGNARLSGQVRGTVVEAMRHLGVKAGVVVVTVPARGTSSLCPTCLSPLTHHPAPDRLTERGWKWAHCTGCGLSLDRDHAAARRIVSRGLFAQNCTTLERATGVRAIRTTVEGTVSVVRRPKKTTRRMRRQRQAETTPPRRPRGPRTTPGKARPTPSRPSPAKTHSTRHTAGIPDSGPGSQAFRRAPEARTVPAITSTRVVKRPTGHDTQTPAAHQPVPGHEVPAPDRPEDTLLPAGRRRLSHRICRQRTRNAERTGFHHLHATPVHPLTPRIGPTDGDRTRPRRARKAPSGNHRILETLGQMSATAACCRLSRRRP